MGEMLKINLQRFGSGSPPAPGPEIQGDPVEVVIVNFPQGVSSIEVGTNMSTGMFTQDESKDLIYSSNNMYYLRARCSQDMVIPDFTCCRITYAQANAEWEEGNGYYYDLSSSIISSPTVTIEFAANSKTITIDGTDYTANENDTLLVNSTGIYNSTQSSQLYTYSGGNRFLGLSTTSGALTPDSNYEINDTFTVTTDLTLYSVDELPTVTYDLANLHLSDGTYTITVKAKASGYEDSVASNSVSYTVATANTGGGGSND